LSFNGYLKFKFYNGHKKFEIIQLEVGSFVLLRTQIKKSIIIVFSDSFEVFKYPGGQ
jgi:hypothetical protein